MSAEAEPLSPRSTFCENLLNAIHNADKHKELRWVERLEFLGEEHSLLKLCQNEESAILPKMVVIELTDAQKELVQKAVSRKGNRYSKALKTLALALHQAQRLPTSEGSAAKEDVDITVQYVNDVLSGEEKPDAVTVLLMNIYGLKRMSGSEWKCGSTWRIKMEKEHFYTVLHSKNAAILPDDIWSRYIQYCGKTQHSWQDLVRLKAELLAILIHGAYTLKGLDQQSRFFVEAELIKANSVLAETIREFRNIYPGGKARWRRIKADFPLVAWPKPSSSCIIS